MFNDGALVHEMVVVPLPVDGPGTRATGSDGKIDEPQSLGEASRSCAAGTGSGIAPGGIGWTTMTLKSGRYELVYDERRAAIQVNGCTDPAGVVWISRRCSTTWNPLPRTAPSSSALYRVTGSPEHRSGPSGANVAMMTDPPGATARRTTFR